MIDLSLYLVTDPVLVGHRPLEEVVEAAVKGGCTLVQLREKDLPTEAFIARARKIKKVLSRYGVPLIINDRADVALAAGADGVHLGQEDMSVIEARELLGEKAIIGLSIEKVDEVAVANTLPVDYIAVSPVFTTSTKKDIAEPLGLEGCRRIVDLSIHPVVGIGGMNHQTAVEAIRTGLKGIAVVSDIIAAANPEQSARELRKMIDEAQ